MSGPKIRTDIVDIYVFRFGVKGERGCDVEFLQLRRAEEPLAGTWHPVMGHVEEGESARHAAWRELKEETGIDIDDAAAVKRAWQLERVNTYYLESREAILMSPCFAVQVAATVEPTLDESNDAARWIARDHARHMMVWPGQRDMVDHLINDILPDAVRGESIYADDSTLTGRLLRVRY